MILVSAFSGRQIELEAANAGADAFVSKALLDRAGLRAVLERAVAARSAARVPEQDHPRSSLEVALQEVLDCGADETCVHAEKAYYMALFAKEALANGKEPIGVETCARLLGVTGETLRKYSIVASRWSHPELWRLLVERRGANGYRISASHLYELARLPLPLRAAWVERTFAEALSVRALKEALGELGPPGPDGTPGHDADHAI